MKILLLLIGIVLLFSCEKQEPCKVCKTKILIPGQEVVIKVDTVCFEIEQGYFYSFDSLGRTCLKMVGCEKIE